VRRLLTLLIVILLPALAVVPAFAGNAHAGHVSATKKKPHCGKGKTYNNHLKKCVKAKATQGKKPTPKKKPTATKHRTATPRKAPTVRPTKKPTPKPTKKPTRTPTPTDTPTFTPTPTDTPTVTFTPTATFTPTPTLTPTPLPLTASIPVTVNVAPGYGVGLFLCGLPVGATASFSPNPGVGKPDYSTTSGGSFTSTLTVVAPYTTLPNTYALVLHEYSQTSTGTNIAVPPGGLSMSPPTVLFTVSGPGSAALTGSDQTAAVGTQGCTTPPAGFGPVATATPIPQGIQPRATMSSDTAHAGDNETVTASLSVNGKLAANVQVHTTWSFPFSTQTCNALTDASGFANCAVHIAQSSPGYVVQVRVDLTISGQTYTTFTHFTLE
jgi:hypothetical protein